MKKGLGVIIPIEDKDGTFWTDSIVNCDADCLSISSAVLLQNADFSRVSSNKILYICGHGSKRHGTISDLTMHQLALKLQDQNYTGKQEIIIASCHGLRKRLGKNMAEQLKCELHGIGIECKCSAIAHDISIVYKSDDDYECASVRMSAVHRAVFLQMQRIVFDGNVHAERLTRDVKLNKDKVLKWNGDAVAGKITGFCAASGQLLILAAACAISFLLSVLQLEISIFVPIWALWILAELCSLKGFTWSVLLWIPVLLACMPDYAFLVILRLTTALVIQVALTARCMLKYGMA